jgi:hypothetical protein
MQCTCSDISPNVLGSWLFTVEVVLAPIRKQKRAHSGFTSSTQSGDQSGVADQFNSEGCCRGFGVINQL